jgi:hypothetical protein
VEYLPVLAVLTVGIIGFVSMAAAFALAWRRGGWERAMAFGPDGRWPLPRQLMAFGAALGVLFGLLIVVLSLVPGGLPWRQ